MAAFHILLSFPQVSEEVSLIVISFVSIDFLVLSYLLSILCAMHCLKCYVTRKASIFPPHPGVISLEIENYRINAVQEKRDKQNQSCQRQNRYIKKFW